MANPVPIGWTVGSPQSVYQVSTSKEHEIGTKAVLNDGRVFYYTKNATSNALDRGKLLVAQDLNAQRVNLATGTNAIVANRRSVTDITIGTGAMAANEYQDGYLVVTDGGGEGQLFTIESHAAYDASATDVEIKIKEEPAVASDANTTVSLIHNLYDDPQVSVTDQQDVLVGVPLITIPAGNTTTQFSWVQTWGPCPVLCDETFTQLGQAVTIGTGVAGAAEEDDTATTVSQEPIVGYNLTSFVDTEYQAVMLRINP